MTKYRYYYCSLITLLALSLLKAPRGCEGFVNVNVQPQHKCRRRNVVITTFSSASSSADSSTTNKNKYASEPSQQQQQQEEEPPPLPPGRPTRRFFNVFFDDTLRLLNPKSMARYQLSRKKEFGPVFKTNIFGTPAVFVTDDESLQELGVQESLSSKNKSGNSMRACFPPHHQRLFGPNSILVTSGAAHDRIRRLLASSLSPTIVENTYKSIIVERVDEWFEQLQKHNRGNTEESESESYQAMVPRVRSFFIQLMLQVVLGSSNSHDDTLITELANDIEIWSRGLLAPPLTFVPWSRAGKAMRARKRIVAKLREIIGIRQALGRSKGLLAKLLLASNANNSNNDVVVNRGGGDGGGGGGLTEDEIIDNILTLLFAGSDTTASVTISMWKVLSEHPSVKLDLQKANDEQIEKFVQLVMQAYPPAPFSMRLNTITDRDVVVGGYRIPPNWLVVYGFAGALLSRTSPNKWKLEKEEEVGEASTSSPSTTSTNSWLPFGTGPRQCPGRFLANLELTVIARKLATLDWELESGQNLKQRYTPGFFPVDGFKVKFHTS